MTYTVYALALRRGNVWYYIGDDLQLGIPVWYPAPLCEVVDGRLSRLWHWGAAGGGERDGDAVFAMRAWADNPRDFYDRLSDGDSETLARFLQAKEFMDAEVVHEGVTLTAEDLGDGWILCPNCHEAWRSTAIGEVVRCPACGLSLVNPRLS